MFAELFPWLILLVISYTLGAMWGSCVLLLVPGPFWEAIQAGIRWPKWVVVNAIAVFRE